MFAVCTVHATGARAPLNVQYIGSYENHLAFVVKLACSPTFDEVHNMVYESICMWHPINLWHGTSIYLAIDFLLGNIQELVKWKACSSTQHMYRIQSQRREHYNSTSIIMADYTFIIHTQSGGLSWIKTLCSFATAWIHYTACQLENGLITQHMAFVCYIIIWSI